MNELEEVFKNYDSKEYNKEEYAEYKRKEKEQVYGMIDSIAEKVVKDENEFKKYLDSQCKFDSYSVGNALLVTAQMPQATQLRDYESWKNAGAYLKKAPKFVKILEPR